MKGNWLIYKSNTFYCVISPIHDMCYINAYVTPQCNNCYMYQQGIIPANLMKAQGGYSAVCW